MSSPHVSGWMACAPKQSLRPIGSGGDSARFFDGSSSSGAFFGAAGRGPLPVATRVASVLLVPAESPALVPALDSDCGWRRRAPSSACRATCPTARSSRHAPPAAREQPRRLGGRGRRRHRKGGSGGGGEGEDRYRRDGGGGGGRRRRQCHAHSDPPARKCDGRSAQRDGRHGHARARGRSRGGSWRRRGRRRGRRRVGRRVRLDHEPRLQVRTIRCGKAPCH